MTHKYNGRYRYDGVLQYQPIFTSPFTEVLAALQPVGCALPHSPESVWWLLLNALALEFDRASSRLERLQAELTVDNSAIELLDLWETALGLPDPCAPAPTDINIRRARVRAKLSSAGGQSISYFQTVIDQFGFDSQVVELTPFRMGQNGMGDTVGGGEWANTWQVGVLAPLTAATKQLLRCMFNQIKPAHTAIIWGFDGQPPPLTIFYNGRLSYNSMVNYGGL